LSRLPPLTALRAFVVAARHSSFSRAADELHVSTTAIGQQVRILETHLGQTLFSRQRGELALTEAGATLYPGLAEAFDGMVESVSSLVRVGARPALHLTVDSAFAARLLAPKLGLLREGLPQVELSISTIDSSAFDVARFDDDCAIVALSEPLPGFHCEPLFDDQAVAVCTPLYAERHGLFGAPENLRNPAVYMLRGDGEDPAFDWSHWLKGSGISFRPLRFGLRFSQQPVLTEATLAGQGISVLRHSLIAEELSSGRLVNPFSMARPISSRFHLVAAEHRCDDPEIRFLAELLSDRPTGLTAAA
jgi:LysR family glycine cleavage system transcriptional activator